MKVTIEALLPELDNLQHQIEQAQAIIRTLRSGKDHLEQEVINLNEKRVIDGSSTFSGASYYALRSQYQALKRSFK